MALGALRVPTRPKPYLELLEGLSFAWSWAVHPKNFKGTFFRKSLEYEHPSGTWTSRVLVFVLFIFGLQ